MKAVLRHAMLQYEVVFRNQVRELQRLYWTQKNLMREMCRAAGEAALTSALVRSQTGEVGVCDGEATLAPTRSQTVRKNWPVEVGMCDGDVRKEKQREMILDFQFPADEYIKVGGVPVSTGSETGIIDLSSLNGGSELEKSVIFRWLMQFTGFKERLLADDLFLTKVGMDVHWRQVSGARMLRFEVH